MKKFDWDIVLLILVVVVFSFITTYVIVELVEKLQRAMEI